jgi:hypothetical protein
MHGKYGSRLSSCFENSHIKKYQFSLELKYTFLGIGSRFAMHNGGIIHSLQAGTVSREELILFLLKIVIKRKKQSFKVSVRRNRI